MDDVLAELKQKVPENEGRWTPSQAASAYGETEQFMAETGLDRLAEQSTTAAEAAFSPGAGPDEMEASLNASAALGKAAVDADTSRNRYQQSTEFTPLYDPAEAKASIDEATALGLADVDAQRRGQDVVGQQQQQGEVAEYGFYTGDEAMQDPDYQSAGLSPEQKARLPELRATAQAQAQEQYDVTDYGRLTGNADMLDPDYQSAGLSPQQQAELQQLRQKEAQDQMDSQAAQDQRVQESRERAEERMATPIDERQHEWNAFGGSTPASRRAQRAEQSDVRSYGIEVGDQAMRDPNYQSAGLSPEQKAQLDDLRATERARDQANSRLFNKESYEGLSGPERSARGDELVEERNRLNREAWQKREDMRARHNQGTSGGDDETT